MKRIDLNKKDFTSMFSDLEADILNMIWKIHKVNSNILYKKLGKKHNVAHSTVAVTLERLCKRGLLKREPEKCQGGMRYIYYPKLTKEELGNQIATKFVDLLRKTFGESCVANLKKKIK